MSQKSFDFSRASRLRLIDELKLPQVETIGRRAVLLRVRSLLRAIDDFAGKDSTCWASRATLAAKIGCSERTCQRILSLLKRLGLVASKVRGPHDTPLLSLNWSLLVDWSSEFAHSGETTTTSRGDIKRSAGETSRHSRGDSSVSQTGTGTIKETGIPEEAGNSGVFQTERIPVKQSSVFRPLTADDLKDVATLMSWFAFALTRQNPVVRDCEADRRFVVEAAVRALEESVTPVKLFGWLILRNKRGHITEAQGDKADRLLKAYWRSSLTDSTSDTSALVLERA